MSETFDIAVIGGGPGGAAVAMRAARAGAKVVVFEKGAHGRDKVCGDGLTPRAVAALEELDIPLALSHRIDGLRMIAGKRVRELPWTRGGRFPSRGGVWPRRLLDAALIDAAAAAGADVRFEHTAEPTFDLRGRVDGVQASTASRDAGTPAVETTVKAKLVVAACGPPGKVARMLGAVRDPNEPYGLAIRTYVESPRADDRLIEACLTIRGDGGSFIPGYGWMFPCGDGTVNLGVGALSTMKGFSDLNLNHLIDRYRSMVADSWQIGDNLERPRAWRLPMSTLRRSGPGWVAIGDAAGLVNPMNGEGIDYALESGIIAADKFLADPDTAEAAYDQEVAQRYDAFLSTGRRFAYLIGHPRLMRTGLAFAVSTDRLADITLQVMANLVDSDTDGAAGFTLNTAEKALGIGDPLLRRFRASR